MRAAFGRGVNALGLAVAVLIGGCTASGQSANSPAPTPTPRGDQATYTAAVAQVQAFLDRWVKDGPYAAADEYLVAEEQVPACVTAHWPTAPGDQCQAPMLLSAKVESTDIWSWASSDDFTLGVRMSLHFSEDPTLTSNWGQGTNDRFFRFTRPDAGSDYRMYVATSP